VEVVGLELQALALKIGNLQNDPVLAQIGQRVEAIMAQAGANQNTLHTLFEGLSRDHLVKIQGMLDGTNCESKIQVIQGAIFKLELDSIKTRDIKMTDLKQLMRAAVHFMSLKGFSNERGEINWRGTMKSAIEDIKQRMDMHAGAVAAAAAAAVEL
jgi:hypothetical protein